MSPNFYELPKFSLELKNFFDKWQMYFLLCTKKKFQILLKENVLSFLCKWIGSFLPDQSFVLGKAKYNKKIFKHYFPPFFQTPLMVKFVLNVPYKKRDSHWG